MKRKGIMFKYLKKCNEYLLKVIGFPVRLVLSNTFVEKNGKAIFLLKKKSKPQKERKKPKTFDLSLEPEGVFTFPKSHAGKLPKDVKMKEAD